MIKELHNPTEFLRVRQESLFSVFIDQNCGHKPEPDWEENSHPKPLRGALQESQEARATGWITKIEPVL